MTREPEPCYRLILHGKSVPNREVREAVEILRSEGHRLEVRVTWEAGDAHRLAREARADGVQTVIAGGGDGTLNEVVHGLLDDRDEIEGAGAGAEDPAAGDCALGLVPLGTANDFATACGLPESPLDALRLAVTTRPCPIDVGRMNDRSFINIATGGLGAEITSETSEGMKSVLGRLAYLLTGLTRFQDLQPAHGRLRGEDFEWEGSFLALAVGNGRLAGGGMDLFPSARLDDGRLRLLLVPEIPMQRRVATLTAFLQRGREAVDEEVVTVTSSWLEIEVPGGLHLNLDGEPAEGTSFRFEVDPGRLRFHLGAQCPLTDRP